MRYIKPLVCLTACLYLLTSCGGDPEPIETDLSPAQMAAAIINSQDYEQDFIFATPGQDIYELLISASYAVPDGYITDGAICYLDGVEASEIAVLSVDNEDHMAEVQACLSEYLLGRAASFTGYAPKQAAMAEAGVVESIGNYAVMLICEDPTGAVSYTHLVVVFAVVQIFVEIFSQLPVIEAAVAVNTMEGIVVFRGDDGKCFFDYSGCQSVSPPFLLVYILCKSPPLYWRS